MVLQDMELYQKLKLYPPRINMSIIKKADDYVLPVKFHGCVKFNDPSGSSGPLDFELHIKGNLYIMYTLFNVSIHTFIYFITQLAT